MVVWTDDQSLQSEEQKLEFFGEHTQNKKKFGNLVEPKFKNFAERKEWKIGKLEELNFCRTNGAEVGEVGCPSRRTRAPALLGRS